MFGFGNDRGKSPIEHLNEAYSVGGMPFTLIVLGALCLLAPFGEQAVGASNVVNPGISLVVGGSIVAIGALAWVFAMHQKVRLQIALFRLMSEIAENAALSPKDGANFKVALEQALGELPKLISLLTSVARDDKPPSGGG